MLERDTRAVSEKVRLFRDRFRGLDHVHGTYDPRTGRSWHVKQSVTDKAILDHLTGQRPLGVYLLMGERICALAVDYDSDAPNLPAEFVSRAAHYGISSYVEVSKSKGFHAWIFFTADAVPAAKARAVVRYILEELGHQAEVFPKQDAIDLSRGEYGNFINLPFFGPLAVKGRTIFVEPANGFRPVPNQWVYLDKVSPVSEVLLDEVLEVNEIQLEPEQRQGTSLLLGAVEPAWSLPPCARRMLDEGVTECQRVACFRLAVLLRRIGIPFDLGVAALLEWRLKNRPSNGKRILTEAEVRTQTSYAFQREYKGYGCDEPAVSAFCSPTCHVANAQRKTDSSPPTGAAS